jgi:t-SNARE complex subunit (syntaxin)
MVTENPAALQQNVFQLHGGQQMKEITEIYNQIEKRLNEILDLFVQFAVVVQEQGRMIDNIGYNISTARIT